MQLKLNRRDFIRDSFAAAAFGAAGGCMTRGDEVGRAYPGWNPGELDIHFIHTGTSENTFLIFPDGTTMLLDCGHVKVRRPGYAEALPPRPSGDRRAGEWVRRYIERLIPQREIDYLMVSHWHSDHIAGIPDVAEGFRFLNFFDHQYPDVGKYRRDVDAEDFDVLQRWIPSAVAGGMRREPFKVGASGQIRLLHDEGSRYSKMFEVRNLAANGVVWDGGKGVRDIIGEHVKRTGEKRIHENSLSSAIRIRYGDFTYFTGGDIEGTFTGADGRKVSYEAAVGEVAGRVEVCKTNHHAYYKSMCADFVRHVRPKLYLSSTWSPNQINDETLANMTSRELYPGGRTIAFGQVPAFKRLAYADRGFLRDAAPEGHAVVKVAPGGFWYRLYTLSAQDESMRIAGIRDFACG